MVRATHATIVKSLYHLFQQTPLEKPKDKLIISLINKELLQINKSNKSVEKMKKGMKRQVTSFKIHSAIMH